MATIKSYSDLQQSKKLAEILPLESADMYYEPSTGYCTEPSEVRFGDIKYAHPRSIRCWSLAALLDVLPVIIGDVLSENALLLRMDKREDFNVWYENLDSGMVESGLDIIKSNPVDACYELILKLNELNLL